MANWNQPTITSNYLDFVTEMHAKFTDTAQMFISGNLTNFPINTLRYNRSTNLFDEWDGSVWQPKVLSIAGGGTGTNNPAGIRVNLGLGSMSTQNANAVAITGGTITGVTYSASDINTGVMALARGGTGSSLALGAQGSLMISWGGIVQMLSGHYITDLNASYLTAGVVPDARFPAHNAWIHIGQVFQGRQHFASEMIVMGPSSVFSATSYTSNPVWNLMDPNAGVSLKIVRATLSAGHYYIQSVDDGYTAATTLGYFRNDGFLVTDGRLITNTNGYNITHGYISPSVLAPGPAANLFLRGDQVWAVPAGSGGGGTPIPFPSGMISMFANGCPAGWTRVAQFDNRFPMGANSYGQQGGGQRHSHSFSVNSTQEGGHSHSFYSGVGGRARGTASGSTGQEDNGAMDCDSGNNGVMARASHTHFINLGIDIGIEDASASGETSGVGNHSHQVYGETSEADFYPPYTAVFFCQKD